MPGISSLGTLYCVKVDCNPRSLTSLGHRHSWSIKLNDTIYIIDSLSDSLGEGQDIFLLRSLGRLTKMEQGSGKPTLIFCRGCSRIQGDYRCKGKALKQATLTVNMSLNKVTRITYGCYSMWDTVGGSKLVTKRMRQPERTFKKLSCSETTDSTRNKFTYISQI
jgi:hypothetical protein